MKFTETQLSYWLNLVPSVSFISSLLSIYDLVPAVVDPQHHRHLGQEDDGQEQREGPGQPVALLDGAAATEQGDGEDDPSKEGQQEGGAGG